MSRHISRKQRWVQENALHYQSDLGRVVYEQRAWYGVVAYWMRTGPQGELPARWERHTARLGPFKRPRNAMVAVEREVDFLRNRHGDNLLLGDRLPSET